MVQGLPAVDWKIPANTIKLFAAVLAFAPGTPDCKKIANVFGPNVPPSAISYRLNVIRKEGIALGFTAGSGSSSSHAKTNGLITPAKRSASAAKKNVLKGKGRQRENNLNNDPDDDSVMPEDSVEEESAAETDHEKTPTTPVHSTKRQKVIGGRVTKRVSPRKSTETNYKELEDPFVFMNNAKDENGDNIFGEPSGTESEDTYATDGSFKETGDEAVVKMEEAV